MNKTLVKGATVRYLDKIPFCRTLSKCFLELSELESGCIWAGGEGFYNIQMNKYFKNETAVTPDALLKMYTGFQWPCYPYLNYEKDKFYNLCSSCKQTDEYADYIKKVTELEKTVRILRSDLDEIEDNRETIILKNSKEEYDRVLKEVKDNYYKQNGNLIDLKHKPPKSKSDILAPIHKDIRKAEQDAEQELVQRRQDEKDRCHCDGWNCEC